MDSLSSSRIRRLIIIYSSYSSFKWTEILKHELRTYCPTKTELKSHKNNLILNIRDQKEHISFYTRSWKKQYRPKSTMRIIQKENNLIKILNAHKTLRLK